VPDRRLITRTLALVAAVGQTVALIGELEFLTASNTREALLFIKGLSLDQRVGDVLFGGCAVVLLAVCWRSAGQASRKYWWTLTAFFGLAAVVKVTGSMGRFSRALRSLDSGSGWYGWAPSSLILVAIQAMLACGLGYFFLKWVQSLDTPVRWRMLLGGAVFVAGAVGAEAMTEWLWSVYGPASIQYVLADGLENALEAAGLIVFVDGLLIQCATDTRRRWQPA